jgi:hypothetical protein
MKGMNVFDKFYLTPSKKITPNNILTAIKSNIMGNG